VPARALVDAGGEALVLGVLGTGEDESAVAVGAFDEVGLTHLQIDPRMAERAADAVAGDAPGVNGDDLRRRNRVRAHGVDRQGDLAFRDRKGARLGVRLRRR
jgi:hypothetical protein